MQNPISKLIPFIGGEFPRHFNELIDKVSTHENISEEELKVRLWRAYEFGSEYHQGQKRKSGESYFHSHCVEVAKTLASCPAPLAIVSNFIEIILE